MRLIVIKMPDTEDDWQAVADRFWEKWQFPNCIGALDGKDCKIQQPSYSGSLDWNHYQSFSVNLTAICDADYKFVIVFTIRLLGRYDSNTTRTICWVTPSNNNNYGLYHYF
jgi:hypothetical protein